MTNSVDKRLLPPHTSSPARSKSTSSRREGERTGGGDGGGRERGEDRSVLAAYLRLQLRCPCCVQIHYQCMVVRFQIQWNIILHFVLGFWQWGVFRGRGVRGQMIKGSRGVLGIEIAKHLFTNMKWLQKNIVVGVLFRHSHIFTHLHTLTSPHTQTYTPPHID